MRSLSLLPRSALASVFGSRAQVRASTVVLLALVMLLAPAGVRADRDTCLAAHEQAQVERMEGHYLAARESLLACAQRECPKLISNECTTWLGQLDSALPTVVFAAEGEQRRDLTDVQIQLNGKPIADHIDGRALALDPGVYTLRVDAAGYTPVEQSLTIRDGEKNRLVQVSLQRSASSAALPVMPRDAAAVEPARTHENARVDPRAQRLWLASYALGSAATVGFAVTLGAAARGHRMEQKCKDDGCSDSYADHGKALYRTVNISAIVGGVFAVATLGTVWSALRRDQQTGSESRASHGVGGYADNRGATLTAWGRW